jgi:hypothetical protein
MASAAVLMGSGMISSDTWAEGTLGGISFSGLSENQRENLEKAFTGKTEFNSADGLFTVALPGQAGASLQTMHQLEKTLTELGSGAGIEQIFEDADGTQTMVKYMNDEGTVKGMTQPSFTVGEKTFSMSFVTENLGRSCRNFHRRQNRRHYNHNRRCRCLYEFNSFRRGCAFGRLSGSVHLADYFRRHHYGGYPARWRFRCAGKFCFPGPWTWF